MTEPEPPISLPGDGKEHFEVYSQHSAVLRTWLVAYGIGAPVLFMSQEAIWVRLSESGMLRQIGFLFLLGVFMQVALASINKSVMWACYFGETSPAYQKTRRYRFACWLSERYAIDFVIDLGSMSAFGYATFLCFSVLASSAGT